THSKDHSAQRLGYSPISSRAGSPDNRSESDNVGGDPNGRSTRYLVESANAGTGHSQHLSTCPGGWTGHRPRRRLAAWPRDSAGGRSGTPRELFLRLRAERQSDVRAHGHPELARVPGSLVSRLDGAPATDPGASPRARSDQSIP